MKQDVGDTELIHPLFSDFQSIRHKKGKIVSAHEAAMIIRDGDTIGLSGFIGALVAEEILIAIKERYLKTGAPRDLTLVHAAGVGDNKERSANHLAQEGLLKKLICGHVGHAPKLQDLIRSDKILAYNFPMGTITQLFRDIAAHRPGTITAVGIDTFIDPRIDGGKLNMKTKQEGDNLIERMSLNDNEFLFFKAFPINIAIIRGTTADMDGNISMEKEALTAEVLPLAMAAKNSNGFVIAQVERIAEHGALHPRQVKVPGILVDCVVVCVNVYCSCVTLSGRDIAP